MKKLQNCLSFPLAAPPSLSGPILGIVDADVNVAALLHAGGGAVQAVDAQLE